jgi:transcription termination factor NusB
MEKLRTGYGPKVQSLEQRIRRAEQQVDREKSQSWDQKLNTFLSFGSAVLAALFGRKLSSTANVTRATSSMKSASRAMREHADVARAEENATVLRQQLADIDAELQEATSTLREKWDVDRLEIVENPIKPKKTDLSVEEVALVWTPWIVDANDIADSAY